MQNRLDACRDSAANQQHLQKADAIYKMLEAESRSLTDEGIKVDLRGAHDRVWRLSCVIRRALGAQDGYLSLMQDSNSSGRVRVPVPLVGVSAQAKAAVSPVAYDAGLEDPEKVKLDRETDQGMQSLCLLLAAFYDKTTLVSSNDTWNSVVKTFNKLKTEFRDDELVVLRVPPGATLQDVFRKVKVGGWLRVRAGVPFFPLLFRYGKLDPGSAHRAYRKYYGGLY